jgi:homoserine O-acetyltransferase
MKATNLKTGTYTFAEPPNEMPLESGRRFGPITLYYETYGTLNADKSNVIYVCHALTGNAHLTGRYPGEQESSGWWFEAIGPGKPFDTDKYFIIASNCLGGCSGSTGPYSIDPKTDKPYGPHFPPITIRDIVNAKYHLLRDHFGFQKILCITGGSIGGMQVLQWAVDYPDSVTAIMPIAASSALNAQAIAFNKVGRQAIMADPHWNGGDYYDSMPELQGLALARMVAHITYLSEEGMRHKFGRGHTNIDKWHEFDEQFQVESYLDHQGEKFIKVRKFDANSYIYLSRAMDWFDLTRGYGTIEDALARIQARVFMMSFTSDWLFPAADMARMAQILEAQGKQVIYHEIRSDYGHDAFLVEYDKINPYFRAFLSSLGA